MEKCLSLHWRVYLFRSVWMSLCHYVIMSRLTSHICTYYVTLTSATIKNYLFYKTSWPFYLIPWPPRRWDEMRGDCNKYPWIICSAQPHHSGNYTCKPSSSTPASIQLFVLGESFYFLSSCLKYYYIWFKSTLTTQTNKQNCSREDRVAFFWSPALTRTEFKSYGLILMLRAMFRW